MSADDRELEALLRRALADEAGRVEPAGDGLRRIRDRTARPDWRARWSRWSVPGLVAAGVAALVAAVTVLPRTLPDEPAPVPPAASGPTSPATTPPADRPDLVGAAVSPAASPPSPVPAPSGELIPGAGVADLATVWPYASRAEGYARAEADVDAGTLPDLTRPDRAATAFVASFLGPDGLTAVSAGAWQAGLRMEVRRGDAPISLVYLVRVRVGDDAPYVVVDAMAPGSLTLLPPAAPGLPDPELTVAGAKHSAGRLDVELRAPGGATATAAAGGTVAAGEWTARLGRQPGRRVDLVAAWTTDADGDVVGFAAAPVVAAG